LISLQNALPEQPQGVGSPKDLAVMPCSSRFRFTASFALALIQASAFAGQSAVESDPPSYALTGKDISIINSWEVFGPYLTEADDSEVRFRGELIRLEEVEKSILGKVFSAEATIRGEGRRVLVNLPSIHTLNFMPLRGDAHSVKGTVYAAFEISAEHAENAYLLLGSADGVIVWLNGLKLWETPPGTTKFVTRYSDVVPLTLKVGANRVLIEIMKLGHFETENFWELSAGIVADESTAASAVSYFARSRFLESQLLSSGSLLKLRPGAYFKSKNSRLIVRDCSGTAILSRNLGGMMDRSVGLNLPDGGYEADLSWAGSESREYFAVGDPEILGRELNRSIHSMTPSALDIDSVRAYEFRIRHLLEPEHRKSRDKVLPIWLAPESRKTSDPGWSEKFVYALCRAEEIVGAKPTDLGAAVRAPGFHIFGYRSKIDEQVQYYGAYFPETGNSANPVPLIIDAPYVNDPLRPFLETVRLAQHDYLMLMGDIASRYGCALVFPFSRGNSYGNPIYQTDIDEILADLSRRRAIDPDRIYLYNMCSGGMGALLTAELDPTRYAAVSVSSPIIYRQKNRWPFPSKYVQDSSRWLFERSPFSLAENLRAMPIQLLYYETWAHTPPISEDLAFVERASSLEIPVDFQAFQPDELNEFYGFEESCQFFSGKRRNPYPNDFTIYSGSLYDAHAYWAAITERDDSDRMMRLKVHREGAKISVEAENVGSYKLQIPPDLVGSHAIIAVMTNGKLSFSGRVKVGELAIRMSSEQLGLGGTRKSPQVDGPISRAFDDRLILVHGTMGDRDGIAASSAVVSKLNQSWKEQKFTDCLIREDRDISQNDIETSNLVLVGTEHSNAILARIWNSLPIKRNENGFSIGRRTLGSPGATIIFCCPNPENPNRYIIVVTSSSVSFSLPELDLSLDGQYDYMVEQPMGAGFRLSEGGYFDETWRTVSPTFGGESLASRHAGQ
jgi:hypothetical protein